VFLLMIECIEQQDKRIRELDREIDKGCAKMPMYAA
jgi:hypothetical protein